MGALAFLGASLPGLAQAAEPMSRGIKDVPFKRRTRLPFVPVAVTRADTITVPSGYTATTFIPWGTPITGRYPAWLEDASNTAEDQAQQVGMHHDGMHFFPMNAKLGGRQSDHGLLVLNHEYIDAPLLHRNGPTVVDGKRVNVDEVRKEINAHGVSVVEIRRGPRGEWSVLPTARNRRITGATPMRIEGPARGHALMRTRYSPSGTSARGTLNNCANGFTPWGTYLTCEENWAGYFATADAELPRELSYGVRGAGRYGWETVAGDEFERFNATRIAATAQGDYRNEPNTFGWVVEIDPFDPHSTPIKHTALGRFAHEGLVFAPVKPGRPVVCYSGDDSQNEYIYKYVSRDKYRPQRSDEPAGRWRPLRGAFQPGWQWRLARAGSCQPSVSARLQGRWRSVRRSGEVLINTRLAADIVGATKMDRPEWGAVHPDTGEVYFTLTNNSGRQQSDAANPRSPNAFGHIIRWREASRDFAGTRFTWDIYLLAGPEENSRSPKGRALDATNILASPDGLWFDDEGPVDPDRHERQSVELRSVWQQPDAGFRPENR